MKSLKLALSEQDIVTNPFWWDKYKQILTMINNQQQQDVFLVWPTIIPRQNFLINCVVTLMFFHKSLSPDLPRKFLQPPLAISEHYLPKYLVMLAQRMKLALVLLQSFLLGAEVFVFFTNNILGSISRYVIDDVGGLHCGLHDPKEGCLHPQASREICGQQNLNYLHTYFRHFRFMKQRFADKAISFITLNPLFCRKNSLIAEANHFENLLFHLRFV